MFQNGMLHNGTLKNSTFQSGKALQNGTLQNGTVTKQYMWQKVALLQNGTYKTVHYNIITVS